MNKEEIHHYRYIGKDPGLKGAAALGREGKDGRFLVQVDDLTHDWAHGWYETLRSDWLQSGSAT